VTGGKGDLVTRRPSDWVICRKACLEQAEGRIERLKERGKGIGPIWGNTYPPNPLPAGRGSQELSNFNARGRETALPGIIP
jgi:hypothetical protein